MSRAFPYTAALALLCGALAHSQSKASEARVLVFYTLAGEADHMLFATDALRFFGEIGDSNDFHVDATTNWAELNEENLKRYKLVVWLNSAPPTAQQPAFEQYMNNGGAWLGFHVSAFTTNNSRWRWFREFIGNTSFGVNNWPPLQAKVVIDSKESAVTQGIPGTFVAPVNEWYSWRPSPRLDKNIQVLVSLDPSQFPLGIKSLITDKDPDVPVVWTNTKFKMLYMNMGHGDKVFTSPTQNRLIENGVLWLLRGSTP